MTSRQLHDSGAEQRGQRSNHQKYRKAGDADPNSGSRQEFDVAESKALKFSECKIQSAQQPEHDADGRAFARRFQTGRRIADD